MVVGVEERTKLETEIVTSHDKALVQTRKRKQNLRNYSPSKTSVSGMGGGTMSTSTTSSLSTPGLSTSTGSKVMGMVKEWSRKGADLPDQFVRRKIETSNLGYLFKQDNSDQPKKITSVRAWVAMLEGTAPEESGTPPPSASTPVPLCSFGGKLETFLASKESPLKRRRLDSTTTPRSPRTRRLGPGPATPGSTRSRRARLSTPGQGCTMGDGRRAPGMTVPTASSPTRDPPPPSTSSGTVTTMQEREGLDHHHLPSPLPPGWPLQAELFLGINQQSSSSSSISSTCSTPSALSSNSSLSLIFFSLGSPFDDLFNCLCSKGSFTTYSEAILAVLV